MDPETIQHFLRAWGDDYRNNRRIPDEAAAYVNMSPYNFVDAVRIQCAADDELYSDFRELTRRSSVRQHPRPGPMRGKHFRGRPGSGAWAPPPPPPPPPTPAPPPPPFESTKSTNNDARSAESTDGDENRRSKCGSSSPRSSILRSARPSAVACRASVAESMIQSQRA